MSIIAQMFDELRSCLRLDVEVVERDGNIINVGERFTVRFGVTNIADRMNGFPRLDFLDVNIRPHATRFAKPVDESPRYVHEQGRPGVLVERGMVAVRVEYVATGALNLFEERFAIEKVAHGTVNARVDLNSMFVLWKDVSIHEDIQHLNT